jgi:hypothetical protein
MRRLMLLISIGFVILSSGCALTQGNLKVGYDVAKAKVGPLSSLKPLNMEIKDFADKREVRDKIGYKRNTFGQATASIVTTTPVQTIVRDAVATEFAKNGHKVVAADPDIVITGEIDSFWFDTQMNFATIEFMGTVGVTMTVTDPGTGETLYSGKSEGHYNEKSLGGLERTWERVMNTALENMIRQMGTDKAVVDCLKAWEEKKAGSSRLFDEMLLVL